MKKIALISILVLLVAVSVFTLQNYNKSQTNDQNSLTVKEDTSAVKKETSDSNNSAFNQSTRESVKIKATDFKLKDLSGKEVSLSDFKGKKVFLNFFATWCPPCRAEMPEMEEFYQETKNSDLVMLTVNLGEDKATVQKFISSNKFNFPVLLDADTAVATKYQIASIPTSYFIDREGNIVTKHLGSMTKEDMKKYVDAIK